MLGHFSKDGENIFLGFFRMVHAAISHTKIRFHERLNPKIPKPLRNPPESIPQNGKTPDGALAQLPPLRPPAPLLLPLHGGAPATRQNSPPPQPLAYGLPPCPPPRLTPSPHPLRFRSSARALTSFSFLSSFPHRLGAQEVQDDGHGRSGGWSSGLQGMPSDEGRVRQARRVPQCPGTVPRFVSLVCLLDGLVVGCAALIQVFGVPSLLEFLSRRIRSEIRC